MVRVCAGIVFCFFTVCFSNGHGTLDGSEEYRAFWIDAFNSSYKTSAEITSIVNAARAANLNAIIIQVRKRGDAFYDSNFEPKAVGVAADFDPLADIIAKAHDTNAGPRIEVHAWIVAYHVWNSQSAPSQPTHPYTLHPDWLSKNESGATWDGGNYTFDQGHPEAQQHTFNVAMDIISRYDVDGLNFDYIRYSSPAWGYNDVTVARFNERFARTGQPQAADADWKQFRRDQITELMRKVYLHTMATKPHVKISVDAITFAPGITSLASWYNSSAWTSVLQDWRGWMEEGMIDLAIPMAYFRHHEPARALDYENWANFTKDHQYNRHAILGPGIYLNHATNAMLQMRMSRDPSANGNHVKGVAGYSWAVPTAGDITRSTFFSALTQPGITYPDGTPIDPNPTPIFAQPATIPPMPWKVTPTKGHIKGFVYGGAQIFDGAVVTLNGAISKTMTNDATGFYGYVDLPPGNYTLKATAPGYGMMQTSVSVFAGVVTTLDLHLKLPDNIAPKLWDVRATPSDFSANITWRTDERSDSTVEFGTGSDFGTVVFDSTLTKIHSVGLRNLEQRTGYLFRVKSKDAAGNETVSETYSFMTYHEGFVPDIIVDNPEATVSGSWSTGTFATDKYGDNYRFKGAGSGGASLEYRPTLITNGTYAVYAWYPQGSNRAMDAPYVINFDGGSTIVRVNQQTNGGMWNLLGEFNFQAGTSGYVKITDAFTGTGGLQIMADAIKFASVPPPVDLIVDNTQAVIEGNWNTSTSGDKYGFDYNYAPSSSVGNPTSIATFSPAIAVPGKYNIYAFFPGNATRTSRASLVISYHGGTIVTNLNQTSSSGGWRKIASELDFAIGTSGYVQMANDTGENVIINKAVVADAFRFSLAEPPSIILNPGNQIVTNGGTARFSIEVFGGGPLRYQWKCNGTDIAGGTNRTLTMPNLTMSDGGQIWVDVSNDSGSATSLSASLLMKFAVHPQFSLISRLPDGRFELKGEGDNGTYHIDVSTNLIHWEIVSEVANTNGTFSFSDSLTNLPARYYRMRWQQ